MKTKQHWTVITRDDGFPAIQMKGQDTPFIVFANDTVLGERAARRWADTICLWLNEHMRLGWSENKPVNCDPMILARLHAAEAELTKLNLENQSLHNRLVKLKGAYNAASDALYGFREAIAKDKARASNRKNGKR